MSPVGQKIHVIDVGANIGIWSSAMLAAAEDAGRSDDLHMHVFEPSAYTYDRLETTLGGTGARLLRMAVGDQIGSSLLYVVAPGAGTNSLHQCSDVEPDSSVEEVAITTLTCYAERAKIAELTLVKIDTEGHDLSVLRGARDLFDKQRISIVQFEYNHRWIYARNYLRDAFDLLMPLGYRLGKLTPGGVEFYPYWDAELETFAEGNYVACRASVAHQLPTVRWWKPVTA